VIPGGYVVEGGRRGSRTALQGIGFELIQNFEPHTVRGDDLLKLIFARIKKIAYRV